jgi:MurNAc alpha-1-phosphate uridylyltransferase
MHAFILAAGRGKRLLHHTAQQPKPMVRLAGKPCLQHTLEALAPNFSQVTINLAYKGEQIFKAFLDGATLGLQLSYSYENPELETGGGILKALPLLGEAPFVCINGDLYTEFPFANLQQSLRPGMLAHLVLVPTPADVTAADYGVDADGHVSLAQPKTHVFSGISVLHPDLFNHCTKARFPLREPLNDAIANGKVTAEIYQGVWHNINTPESYEALAKQLA